MNLNYYVYISDDKVQMLLSQIKPEAKRRLAFELKVHFGVLQAKVAADPGAEDNRIQGLEAVVAFIRENGDVGTVDDPSAYFEGELEMQWGPLFAKPNDIVFFSGRENDTVVGLGGSLKHVLGHEGRDTQGGYSLSTPLINAIESGFEELPLTRDNSMAISAVHLYATSRYGPRENLRFFARRLLADEYQLDPEDKPTKVLLGTPLFVAYAE